MENYQINVLNNLLTEIGILRRREKDKTNSNDNLQIMGDKYNKNNTYFYFEIFLIELLPSNQQQQQSFAYINKLFPNLSPQEIFIKHIKGNNSVMTNYRDIFCYETINKDLFNMVPPNLTKEIWYLEKDLKPSRIIKVYAVVTITDMQNILKNCPLANICLCPSMFNINDPDDFVKIINNLSDDKKKCIDFIPYLRKYSKYNTINELAVYYLTGNIKKVNSNCFK